MARIGLIILFLVSSFFSGSAVMAQDTPPTLSPEETRLYDMVMEYRKTKGLPSIPLSPSLTYVAQQHAKDLHTNRPFGGGCNMHSWSRNGKWSSCCYTSDHRAAQCMWDKPREMTGYQGNGYEIAHGYSNLATYKGYDVNASGALEGWKKSPGHHAVMINSGMWNKPWKAIGIGMYKDFAVIWFGHEADDQPFRINDFQPKEEIKPVVVEEKVAEKQPDAGLDTQKEDLTEKSSTKASWSTNKNNRSEKSPRFAIEAEAGLNYMIGSFQREPEEYGFSLTSGQVGGMLGVRMGSRPRRKAPIFGVFGTYSFNSDKALERYFSGTEFPEAVALTDSSSTTLEVEGGFLLWEALRISGGVGQTNFTLLDGTDEKLEYYTTTLGFQFGLKNVKFFVRNKLLFGKDIDKLMMRPSVGMLLHFNVLRL